MEGLLLICSPKGLEFHAHVGPKDGHWAHVSKELELEHYVKATILKGLYPTWKESLGKNPSISIGRLKGNLKCKWIG